MEEKPTLEDLLEKVESQIKETIKEGVKRENVEYLYKLTDIHKDVKNEEYWKKKGEYYDEIRKL